MHLLARYWVVVAAVFLAWPCARAQEDPFHYPGAREVPLADSLSFNGVPVQGTYFMTRDSMDQVAAFYRQAAAEQGLMFVESGSPGRRTLVAMGMDATVRFSVNMYETRSGVMVFPSRMPLHRVREAGSTEKVAASTVVPIIPGATVLGVLESRDSGMLTETMQYETDQPMDRCVRFLLDRMRTKGFKVDERATRFENHVAVLSFYKVGIRCTISITRDTRRRKTLVSSALERRPR